MFGWRILASLALAVLAASTSLCIAGAEEVHDVYEVELVSPTTYRVNWTATVLEMHVNGDNRTWDDIVTAGMEDDAGDIALQVAVDTLDQMWWGVSTSAGPFNVTADGFTADLVVTASERTWALEPYHVASIDDVIDATLEMGGTVGLLTNLVALDGHTTMAHYVSVGLMTVVDRTESIDGLGGAAQRVLMLGLNGTGSVEDRAHGFEADGVMPDYFNLTMHANVSHFTLDPARHGLDLPPSITILRVNAGGMRVYVDNGFTSWEKVTSATERNITTDGLGLNRAFSDAFGGNASLEFSWAPGTLGPFPYEPGTLADQPPIVGHLFADMDIGLFDVDAETITGFLNSGGWFWTGIEADLTDYEYDIRLEPPPGLWADAANGTRSGDAAVWTGTGPAWLDAWVRAVDAPLDHRNDSRITVDIDLSDVELMAGRLNFALEAVGEIRWIRITQEIADSLPRNVDIRAVPADLIRLMYNKGLITDSDIDELASRITEGLEESSFSADVQVNFSGHQRKVDVEHMDGEPAVTFTIRSRGTLGMSGGGSTLMAITVPLEFELASQKGWRTTYDVLLPAGLTVSDMKVSEGKISKKASGASDRLIVEIPEGSESVVVSLTLTVGLWFLITQFCAICTFILIALLLLVLLKAWKMHKDNRRRREDDEFVRQGLAAQAAIARGEVPGPAGGTHPPERPPDEGPPVERHPDEDTGMRARSERRERRPPGDRHKAPPHPAPEPERPRPQPPSDIEEPPAGDAGPDGPDAPIMGRPHAEPPADRQGSPPEAPDTTSEGNTEPFLDEDGGEGREDG
ncbi:MAG: hypothetical protein L0Z54_04910 [Thermoplasmata archaeon]|nr:hypothetical protein [Thermoplasmata archaeon]